MGGANITASQPGLQPRARVGTRCGRRADDYLQTSVLPRALTEQCGAGAVVKKASPHWPVVANGESITSVPLAGMRVRDIGYVPFCPTTRNLSEPGAVRRPRILILTMLWKPLGFR